MAAATVVATVDPRRWVEVRCPVHPSLVLAEIRGDGAAEVRKDCRRCPPGRRRWRYVLATGELVLELTAG